MANKFIVFVVFAAVAQASLASAVKGSSDIKAAQEATRAAWHEGTKVYCRLVRDKWWPIEEARDQFQSYQTAGRKAFLNVAQNSDNSSLLIAVNAFATALRDGTFEAVVAARNCENCTTAKAAIENYKTQLPYEQIVRDLHKMTKDTGSQTPAVKSLRLAYEAIFAEPEKLLEVTCGGRKTIGPCAIDEIDEKVDAYIKILYSWLA